MIQATSIPVSIPKGHRRWWTSRQRYPVEVKLHGTFADVAGSTYRLTQVAPKRYAVTRPGPQGAPVLAVGEVTEDGVFHTLTRTFFNELSAIRTALFSRPYPAPLAYEMSDHRLVHPGPCFYKHRSGIVLKTHYNLADDPEETCGVCGERFL